MDKQQTIARIYRNPRYQEIIAIEPRIASILQEASRIELSLDYQWYPTYATFKRDLKQFVGWEAEQEAISSSTDYDLILQLLDLLLPLDCVELFPDGGSPTDPDHPCYCEDAVYYVDTDAKEDDHE